MKKGASKERIALVTAIISMLTALVSLAAALIKWLKG